MRIAGVYDEAPAARDWGCVHTGRWRPRLDRLPAISAANSYRLRWRLPNLSHPRR